MEVCRAELQEEDYEIEINIVEATNVYDFLRFFLLAGKWLPRPFGACVWSLIQVLLAVVYTLALPATFIFLFVGAVFFDVYMVLCQILPSILVLILVHSLYVIIIAAAAWIRHMIRCFHGHTMPGRAPGQNLVHYIFSGGIPLELGARQTPFYFRLEYLCMWLVSCTFVRHVVVESFPYWRLQFKNLWHEIFPLYDAVAI